MFLEIFTWIWNHLIQLAAIATIMGLILIYWQLRTNQRDNKRQRTFEMIDRYWRDCYEANTICNPTPSPKPPPQDMQRVDYWDARNQSNLIIVFGYFVELGHLWEEGLIDKRVLRKQMFQIPAETYKRHKDHITSLRQAFENEDMGKSWDRLVGEWEKHPREFNFIEWLSKDIHKTS